jgi:hypothetical protein
MARFEKLEFLRSVFQIGLAFPGQIRKESSSDFPEIYGKRNRRCDEGLQIAFEWYFTSHSFCTCGDANAPKGV